MSERSFFLVPCIYAFVLCFQLIFAKSASIAGCQFDGYDLSGLDIGVDYLGTEQGVSSAYYMNPCGPVRNTSCLKAGGSNIAVCQYYVAPDTFTSLGYWEFDITWEWIDPSNHTQGVTQIFNNSFCPKNPDIPATVQITWLCGPSSQYLIDSIVVFGCTYYLVATSPVVCLPPGDAKPCSNERSLSSSHPVQIKSLDLEFDTSAVFQIANGALPLGSRTNFQTVYCNQQLFVLAGRNVPGSVFYNDVWSSKDYGTTWAQVSFATALSAGRDNLGAACFNNQVVIIGGGGSITSAETWYFTPVSSGTATWTQGVSYDPNTFNEQGKTGYLQLIVFNSNLYALGGYQWNNGGFKNTVKYTSSVSSSSSWSTATTPLWSARYGMAVSLTPGRDRIIIFGGLTSTGNANDVWISDSSVSAWKQITQSSFVARGMSAAVLVGGYILIIGGYDLNGNLLNDVYVTPDMGNTFMLYSPSAGFTPRTTFGTLANSADAVMLIEGVEQVSMIGYL